jgi:sterol desaturase/sphingolipid hydroxylase (fatty acid hydroxylase superfamily)
MSNASKYLENPLPHLQEARRSASRILQLQKQLLGTRAELAAIHQAKRIRLGIGAVVFAVMALLFVFGWISVALHEAGWGAVTIAFSFLIFFGLIAAVFTHLFLRSLELEEEQP